MFYPFRRRHLLSTLPLYQSNKASACSSFVLRMSLFPHQSATIWVIGGRFKFSPKGTASTPPWVIEPIDGCHGRVCVMGHSPQSSPWRGVPVAFSPPVRNSTVGGHSTSRASARRTLLRRGTLGRFFSPLRLTGGAIKGCFLNHINHLFHQFPLHDGRFRGGLLPCSAMFPFRQQRGSGAPSSGATIDGWRFPRPPDRWNLEAFQNRVLNYVRSLGTEPSIPCRVTTEHTFSVALYCSRKTSGTLVLVIELRLNSFD